MNTILNGVMNTSQFLRSSQIVSLYSNYSRPTVYSINRGGRGGVLLLAVIPRNLDYNAGHRYSTFCDSFLLA